MRDRLAGSALPRWVRRAFWSIVALEWAAVVAVMALYGVGSYWLVRYFSCADAETVYGPGYSESDWAKIAIGDPRSGVQAQIGDPLFGWRVSDGQWWSYSRQGPLNGNYVERKLRFDGRGRVVEKHEACYLD